MEYIGEKGVFSIGSRRKELEDEIEKIGAIHGKEGQLIQSTEVKHLNNDLSNKLRPIVAWSLVTIIALCVFISSRCYSYRNTVYIHFY